MTTTPQPTRRSYRVREVVAMTGLSKGQIQVLIAAGELRAKRQGRAVLIDAEAFDEWWANLPDYE